MPTRIRLQRHGKKSRAFYHIVIADGRAPRDGKFIEKIGTYNPNTSPAVIELDFDKALTWLQNGAQPSDTCKAILSYKGILHKNHLLKGVKKGALTQEQADAKFEKWLEEKAGKIIGKKDSLKAGKEDAYKKRMEEERKTKEARAAAIAAKNTPPAEEEQVEAEAAIETEVVENETKASSETKADTTSNDSEAPAAEENKTPEA
jgi:small subunit ribosomal protein S16